MFGQRACGNTREYGLEATGKDFPGPLAGGAGRHGEAVRHGCSKKGAERSHIFRLAGDGRGIRSGFI